MSDYQKALAAAREAHKRLLGEARTIESSDLAEAALRDLLAAIDAQPIAGEVWQYRANSTSRGKEWIDCRDERIARDMEALGFEIRCLYAAPPRPQASAEDVELVADYLHDFGYLRPAVYEAFQRIRASLGVGK